MNEFVFYLWGVLGALFVNGLVIWFRGEVDLSSIIMYVLGSLFSWAWVIFVAAAFLVVGVIIMAVTGSGNKIVWRK